MEGDFDLITMVSSTAVGFAIAYSIATGVSYEQEKTRLVITQVMYQEKQKTLAESKKITFLDDIGGYSTLVARIANGVDTVFSCLGKYLARRKFNAGKFDNEIADLSSLIEEEVKKPHQAGEEECAFRYRNCSVVVSKKANPSMQYIL